MLNYKRYTKNNKKNIILLHGLTSNIERWEDYVPILKKKYNLFLIDLFGHGKSSNSNKLRDYKIENQQSQIMEIIKKERIKNNILISHSYSFPIAMELVYKNPNYFKKLICFSPIYLDEKLILKFNKFKFLINIWNYIPNYRTPKKKKYEDKLTFSTFKNSILDIGIKSYLAILDSILTYYKKKKSFLLKIPLLIFYGNNDTLCDKNVINCIKKKFNYVKVIKLDSQGHLYLNNKRGIIIKNINNFLSRSITHP